MMILSGLVVFIAIHRAAASSRESRGSPQCRRTSSFGAKTGKEIRIYEIQSETAPVVCVPVTPDLANAPLN
jgi:hypothetical protein